MTRKQQAARIVNALPHRMRHALQRTPHTAMTGAGLTVRSVPTLTSARGAGGMCDGMSFTEHNTVLYAPTESRRQNFTLLHEYAHFLVTNDEEAMIWLADQDEPALVLEQLCDDIAAALLIPGTTLDRVVGTGPVSGQHLLDLFRQTEASQIVCAIALASRLTCTGAIMLTDRTNGKVVYAALVDQPSVYPSKNQTVPSDHPLTRIKPGQHLCRESFWAKPWGTRRSYYLDAVATEKRTYSVLAELDLWGIATLHLNASESVDDLQTRVAIDCTCGFNGTVTGWPCVDCGQPYCPRCKNCDCERRATLTDQCQRCFISVPRRDLVDGVCSFCR